MTSILIDEPAPGVVRATLNHPERLNAFSYAMYEDLLGLLDRLRYQPEARVLILTGAGRGFCSGHFMGGPPEHPGWVPEGLGETHQNRLTIERLSQIPLAMRAIPQPIIAAINGAVAGIGYSLALAADMALAARSAKFVNTIHNAGTGTELGLSFMLQRCLGAQQAAEILYTARPILADEAAQIGLVLRTVPDESLMDEALALADRIVLNSPLGIALTKQAFDINRNASSLAAAMELEHRGVFIARVTEDAAEKKLALKEKRRPRFTNH